MARLWERRLLSFAGTAAHLNDQWNREMRPQFDALQSQLALIRYERALGVVGNALESVSRPSIRLNTRTGLPLERPDFQYGERRSATRRQPPCPGIRWCAWGVDTYGSLVLWVARLGVNWRLHVSSRISFQSSPMNSGRHSPRSANCPNFSSAAALPMMQTGSSTTTI